MSVRPAGRSRWRPSRDQRKYGHGSRRASGSTKPPDYAVVVGASDWVKEHFPAAGANLWDALHTGEDRHRDPELGLEAEL